MLPLNLSLIHLSPLNYIEQRLFANKYTTSNNIYSKQSIVLTFFDGCDEVMLDYVPIHEEYKIMLYGPSGSLLQDTHNPKTFLI